MLEKGGLKHIMQEKHLVCKGPSAVVGIHFLFLQIQQLVSIVKNIKTQIGIAPEVGCTLKISKCRLVPGYKLGVVVLP